MIYLVGSSNPSVWRQQKEFATILESVRRGPLPYLAESSLPFGTAWNTAANYGKQKSCSRWGSQQPPVSLASTIEIPFANVGAAVVTAENARAFGRDIALALRQYLERPNAGSNQTLQENGALGTAKRKGTLRQDSELLSKGGQPQDSSQLNHEEDYRISFSGKS